MTGTSVSAGAAVGLVAWLLASLPAPAQQPRQAQLTPLEGMKILLQRGDLALAKKLALADIWDDIFKPEMLQQLVLTLDRLNDHEQAAAFCHILLRVLEQPKTASAPSTPALKKWAEGQLARLDVEFNKAKAQYAASAPAKRFTTPEAVSDLWMTQVQTDPHCPHGLYAWTLVGGRSDLKPDWIHNRQGVIHRSGAKYCEEVEGRKGVLFDIPIKAKVSKDADKFHRAVLDRLGHPTQVTLRNVGKCRFLRAGTRAYGFPFIFRALVEGKELLAQRVETGVWSDLKVDLGDSAGKDVQVIVELVVPEGQAYSEGAWLDYLDFFDN